MVANDKNGDGTYSLIFSSLKHPIRRKILRMLDHQDLTFSEMLKILAIDSGHLSYHLDSLGELVTRRKDGKYGLSSFGVSAVKLMEGVEDYNAWTTPSRKRIIAVAKIFSIALALVLLLLSVQSMTSITLGGTNYVHGPSNMPLTLLQNQTFNYSFNFTRKDPFYAGRDDLGSSAGQNGTWVFDPQLLKSSVNEWVEYNPQLILNITQNPSFNCTLNITFTDSKGNDLGFSGLNPLMNPDQNLVTPGIVEPIWLQVIRNPITHPDNYSMKIRNVGPDSLIANVTINTYGQYYERPLFYYGLTGVVLTSSYIAMFSAYWIWTETHGHFHKIKVKPS